MNTIHPEQLINQLNWRYATKQFDPHRKIDPVTWGVLEEALVLSPSSFGLQPWKFVVVTNQSVKERLLRASWGQRQIADCSHLVVFAIKKNLGERDIDAHLARMAEVRNVSVESLASYREMMSGSIVQGLDEAARDNWSTRQTYIALGNFLNSAALLGVDACLMEGFEPEKYNVILDLDINGLSAVVAAAAGYRADADRRAQARKVRFPKDQVLVRI